MANFKVTLEFVDNASGWSETYLLSGSDSLTKKQLSDELTTARAKVLGFGAKILMSRVGNIDASARPVGKPSKFLVGKAGTARDGDGKSATRRGADQPHVAVLMPFRSSAGTKRYVTLSGFPDTWIERDSANDVFKITSAGLEALNAFYDFLIKPGYPLQIKERSTAPGFTNVAVSNVEKDADSGRYLITTAAAHGLALGDKVTVAGVKGNNVANVQGIRKVVNVDSATKYQIDRGPRADLGVVSYQIGAQSRKVGYVLSTANNTEEPYLVSTRKRGRPFAPRRGRRSAKR